jgi:hypothetical protein
MGAHACQCPLRKPTGQRNAKAVCKRNENRRSMATRSRAFWLTQGSVVWNVEADRNELFNGTSRTPARARLRPVPLRSRLGPACDAFSGPAA